MKKIIILLISSVMVFYGSTNVFYLGKTHKFAEQDMIEAIGKYIQKNKGEIIKKMKKVKKRLKSEAKDYSPDGLIALSPAPKNRVFYPDMKYKLNMDIPDVNGKIIYPKGFTFNPLKYLRLSYGIVVINGKNKDEIKWFKNSKYANTIAYRVFITSGNYHDVMKKLNQQIFYCLPSIVKRFKLRHTPSIIIQKGYKIEVSQLCLSCTKQKKVNTK